MLLLSLITLFAGPLMFEWLSASTRIARTLEKVVVVVLVLLVGVFLIPEIIEPLGLWALGLLFAGYLLPGLLERAIKRAAQQLHLFSLYVALAGLLLHALLDGAGLAGSQIQADGSLALAIVLHRFGMGLMLWMIMQPVFGSRVGWLTLFAMAAATILGFEFSESLLPLAGETFIPVVEGLIVGTILHSLVHRGHVHRQA